MMRQVHVNLSEIGTPGAAPALSLRLPGKGKQVTPAPRFMDPEPTGTANHAKYAKGTPGCMVRVFGVFRGCSTPQAWQRRS